MLTRRFQRLLTVSERATLVRLYLAGDNVHFNLRSRINVSPNMRYFSSRKSLVPVCNGQEWFHKIEKKADIISRLCHTEIDDTSNEERLSENHYAHKILKDSGRDLKTLCRPLESIENVSDEEAEKILTNDWRSSSGDEILQSFVSLSCHAKRNALFLKQEKHRPILLALNNKLCHMSDEQLSRVFQCLGLWEGIAWTKCPAYTDLRAELDRECIRRLPRWGPEIALLMCDYWYYVRLARKSHFCTLVLKKLGKKPHQLSTTQFLHFMFIMNVSRKPTINMYEIEYALESKLDAYTANELGVVSMGFFKTQTPLRDQKIVSNIHHKLLEDVEKIDDISISAIMKITRYSSGLQNLNTLKQVLNGLTRRVADLSIPCLTNVIHAAAFVQCFDAELMSLVLEKFEKNIDKARIKDLERLSWILGIFDYNPEISLYRKIVDSIRDPKRKDELEQFPKVVPTMLCHLSQSKTFPVDLIKQHFDTDFLQKVYNYNEYKIGWDYFTLENNVRIEVPDYDGPFLKPNVRDFLSKKFLWSMFQTNEKVRPSDKFVMEVVHMCKVALGSETSIHIDQVLPHYVKPDIIICFDEANNNTINPQPILSEMPKGTIKRPPTESKDLKWIAIVLATQNQMITGTNRYVGPLKCKMRQLKIIGYSPVVISFIEWRNLSSLEEKEHFLRQKLSSGFDRNASVAAL